MDLLVSRKFRVLVMLAAAILYIAWRNNLWDIAIISLAALGIGYFLAVSLEDGLTQQGQGYP